MFVKLWKHRSLLEKGIVAVVFSICILICWIWPGEPRFGGRGLSLWIDEFEKTKSVQSQEAIRAIGEKALPVVYRGFDTNEIRLPSSIPHAREISDSWNGSRWERKIGDAMVVLEVLGPRAKETLPLLRSRLDHMGFYWAARRGIGFVEGDTGETFAWTMKHGSLFAKRLMISSERDRKWEPGVFELLSEARNDPDWRLRPWVYRTLLRGEMDDQARRGFVMEGLTNTLVGVREATLDYLARNPEEVPKFAETVRSLTNNARTKKEALAALKAAGLLSKEEGRRIIVPRPDHEQKVAQR